MATQPRQSRENKETTWSAELRPKVGSTVKHNNSFWVNLTGLNSEPSDSSSDWENQDKEGVGVSGINDVLDVENQVDAGKSLQFKETSGNDLFRIVSLTPRNFLLQTIDAVSGSLIIALNFSTAYIGLNDGKFFRFIGNGRSQDLKPNEDTTSNNEITLPGETGQLLVDSPESDGVKYVRQNRKWANRNRFGVRKLSGAFPDETVGDDNEIYYFEAGSSGKLILPTGTAQNGRIITLMIERDANVTTNQGIWTKKPVLEFAADVDVLDLSLGAQTFTVEATIDLIYTNTRWTILRANNEFNNLG